MENIFKYLSAGKLFKGDKGIWMIYFFLCMISLVEVYSASSRLTFDGGPHWNTVMNQAGCLLGGLLLILVFHRIPCKWFMPTIAYRRRDIVLYSRLRRRNGNQRHSPLGKSDGFLHPAF